MGNKWENSNKLFWGSPKSLQMLTAAIKLKDVCSLEKSYEQSRQPIKKQRHYFSNKGPSSQSYGFSSSHIWMWELGHKESWTPKNWCFWIVVLDKTLESSLDSKEIKPVHPKGNQKISFSPGIPSPPLALFIVMLPKVHLTSHSRMSGSRWVITPSWLSGH